MTGLRAASPTHRLKTLHRVVLPRWLTCVLLTGAFLLTAPVHAVDSEPAELYWTAVGTAAGERWPTSAEAVTANCQRLRAAPPTSISAITRVVRCGERLQAISASRIRVDYTLEADDRTLGVKTLTDSQLTLQRKASCPNRNFPHLRDSDNNRQPPSCWRCSPADLQLQPPRFVGTDTVRWYRNNQCPLEIQPAVANTKVRPVRPPLATGLSGQDEVSFRLLRDAGHGRIAELRFADGRSLLLIGGGEPDAVLLGADASAGSMSLHQGQWRWQRTDGAEYRFAGDSLVFQPAQEKRLRDGRRWQFVWQQMGAGTDPDATPRFRLTAMLDPNGQRYEYRYDRSGKLATVTLQQVGASRRLASHNSQQPPAGGSEQTGFATAEP